MMKIGVWVSIFSSLSLIQNSFGTEFISDEVADQHYWEQVTDELNQSSSTNDDDEIDPADIEEANEYASPAPAPQAQPQMLIEVFKRPVGMGIRSEFGIVSVNGKVKRGFVVSTANPAKISKSGNPAVTPSGNPPGIARRLMVKKRTLKVHGEKISVPDPFQYSDTYKSWMFWGLNIDIKTKKGYPYFIHSTPHYKDLGKPASMGCVRTTHPTAMELFDLAANKLKGSYAIRIYESGSANAKKSIQDKEKSGQITLASLKKQIADDLADAHAITKGDYQGNGHARRGQKLVYPKCGAYDCFEVFGQKKRVK